MISLLPIGIPKIKRGGLFCPEMSFLEFFMPV
jgi:hypothetical protein